MKVSLTTLAAVFCLAGLSGVAQAQSGALTDEQRAQIEQRCAENPERCEKMKARLDEARQKCAENPERCEEMKAKHREKWAERKAACEADPEACEAKKAEMREKWEKRKAERDAQ
jgi:chromosome segregation ATPase